MIAEDLVRVAQIIVLNAPRQKRSGSEHFEEDDSFYDRDGFEHIIDEDRYCEDCDDYHDDY